MHSKLALLGQQLYGWTGNSWVGGRAPGWESRKKSGSAGDLQKELETLFDTQNKSSDKTLTSIPATFLRVSVSV
jgi:hypothetical protein